MYSHAKTYFSSDGGEPQIVAKKNRSWNVKTISGGRLPLKRSRYRL